MDSKQVFWFRKKGNAKEPNNFIHLPFFQETVDENTTIIDIIPLLKL